MSELGELRKELRSDLKDVREDVETVGKQVSHISGILEAKLPELATKTDLDLRVAQQKAKCDKEKKESKDKIKRPSWPPRGFNFNYKKLGAIGGALVALAGAIYALADALIN